MTDFLYGGSSAPEPYPAPTPYLSPSQGGNPYVTPGTVGVSIPQNSSPIMSIPGGNIGWTTGQVTPATSTIIANQPTQTQQTQPKQTVNNNVNQVGYDGTFVGQTVQNANGTFQWNGTSWVQQGGGVDAGAITNQINSGYDAYFNQLNDIMNSNLPAQQQALIGGAESQYQQGVNSLGTQRELQQQGLTAQKGTVQTQQKKTLADIASNLRNSMRAGNIYLGTRGAGDSSASNQYSYALNKLGNEQRGNVMSQAAGYQNEIMQRENALATTYSGALKDLEFQKNQRVNEVAQWFNEQQSALKQAIASGQLSKSQDLASLSTNLLNFAQQQLQTAQAEIANKRSMLDQWAMNNATTIEGLRSNMQAIQPLANTNLAYNKIGTPNQQTGALTMLPITGSYNPEEKKYV